MQPHEQPFDEEKQDDWERSEASAGAANGRVPAQQHQVPPQTMKNGDPLPNPSGDLTVNPSSEQRAGVAVFQQPDEILDEGNPEQYEMASTKGSLPLNEGNEPGYYEWVSGENGGPDNAYSKTDPAGDDDFLKAINAGPTKNGVTPGRIQ
jgi:hypothetical protein